MSFKNDYKPADEVQAQRDWYNGIEFRSKLESKTAQALDNIGIPYVYEPDGYKLSNGMWYRPDFYLTDAKQFIECKGVMSSEDSAKVVGLVEDTGKPVLVLSYDNAMLITRFWDDPDGEIVTYIGNDCGIELGICSECRGMWFYSWCDTFKCRCCGEQGGDHHLGTLAQVGSATDLFRYGQSIAADKPIYRAIADSFNN